MKVMLKNVCFFFPLTSDPKAQGQSGVWSTFSLTMILFWAAFPCPASCFSGWDFLHFGGCLTAIVVSCSQFVWESFTWLWWKGVDPPLPAAYLQAVANFSYDVSEIQYLIQYPQGELPNFFITPLFWTHVALKSKWKTSGLEADSYLGTSRVILIMNNHW